MAVASFGGELYASTRNEATGSQIWRYDGEWHQLVGDGFGVSGDGEVVGLREFGDHLYAGVANWVIEDKPSVGGELWRSPDGMEW